MVSRGVQSLSALALLVLALASLFSACSNAEAANTGRSTDLGSIHPATTGRKITVVATTTQLADFASNVGGDRVSVESLLAANQDPHEFEPKPEDVQRLNSADIVFKNGAGLERHFAKFLNDIPQSVPIVDTSRGVKLRLQEGEEDPHIWHDPRNAKIMVAAIRDGLSRRDPANASTYAANAEQYAAKLDQLDADIRQQFVAVPVSQRKLVTNHDAFGYFVDAYGLYFVGSVIPSGDTTAEPKPADTEKLIQQLKDQHVCAIFTESSVNPKLEQQLGADAGVKVYNDLYGDTLGPDGSDGATYLEMEASNAKHMIEGMSLSC